VWIIAGLLAAAFAAAGGMTLATPRNELEPTMLRVADATGGWP